MYRLSHQPYMCLPKELKQIMYRLPHIQVGGIHTFKVLISSAVRQRNSQHAARAETNEEDAIIRL
jgi:hypothetical protein